MCSLKRLNQQIWAVILLSIILMTPVICGRLILEDSYQDKELSYPQIEQHQGTNALNTKSILVQRLRPLVTRYIREVAPLKLEPCLLKLCMGK